MTDYEIVDRCNEIILTLLKGKSADSILLLKGGRITEEIIHAIPALAKKVLDKAEYDQCMKALNFLKRAVENICNEHKDWALWVGNFLGPRYGVAKTDTDSLALEGLHKAALRYRPTGKFTTYASSWIRQSIQRYPDEHLVCYLDGPAYNGEYETSLIDKISNDDILWGNSMVYMTPADRFEDTEVERVLDKIQDMTFEELADIRDHFAGAQDIDLDEVYAYMGI